MTDTTSHTATNSSYPPSDWVETTLGEVAETNISSIGKDFEFDEILYLDTGSITENKIESLQKYNISEAPSRAKRIVKENDIVYSIVRPNQKHFGFIESPEESLVVSTGFVVVSAMEIKADPKFLYYFLTQDQITNTLQQTAEHSTSTYPSIRPEHIENLELSLPPLPEQQAIASVLSAFDDKIELLREQNKTLEEMGQTIFKRWFVDFECENADADACIDVACNVYTTGNETQKPLPEGWRVGKVKDIVEIFDSKRIPLSSNQRQEKQGKYPYYGATSIMDYVDEFLFDGIYLLLAEDGSVMDQNGYPVLQYVWDKFWVNNHAHVLQGANDFSTEMLYLLFKNTKIAGIVNGAVQLKINQTNLVNLEVIIADKETLKKFDEAIQPIFGKIRDNSEQIQSLARSRDELLPRLMMGEVRVSSFTNN